MNQIRATFATLIVLAGLCLMAPRAEGQRTMRIGVSGGLSIPTGDMADFQKTGFHVGGQLNFSPATLPIEILVDLTYHSFEGDDEGLFDAADFTYLSVSGNAVYVFPGGVSARPYILGGLGMYFGKADIEGSDTNNDLGFNVGGGIRFPLSGITSYIQGRVHFVDEATFIPISFGVIF